MLYTKCSHRAHPANVYETAAKRLGSKLIYRRYDELFQWPSVWITESSRPAIAAVICSFTNSKTVPSNIFCRQFCLTQSQFHSFIEFWLL